MRHRDGRRLRPAAAEGEGSSCCSQTLERPSLLPRCCCILRQLTDSVRLIVGSKGWWSSMVYTSRAARSTAPRHMVSRASLGGCSTAVQWEGGPEAPACHEQGRGQRAQRRDGRSRCCCAVHARAENAAPVQLLLLPMPQNNARTHLLPLGGEGGEAQHRLQVLSLPEGGAVVLDLHLVQGERACRTIWCKSVCVPYHC